MPSAPVRPPSPPPPVIENFQNEDEYNKLLTDQLGFNVIQFHQALVTTNHMNDWTEYVLSLAKSFLICKYLFFNNSLISTTFSQLSSEPLQSLSDILCLIKIICLI